jgi:hypothetical protein
MPRNNYLYLDKNYKEYLTRTDPQTKMQLLENTLFKRKSLINKNSKRYNGIMKNKKLKAESQQPSEKKKISKCPVYKCFKEVADDDQLMKHYNEAHQDLKALGLDLTLEHQS